jgi:hypothetical protein
MIFDWSDCSGVTYALEQDLERSVRSLLIVKYNSWIIRLCNQALKGTPNSDASQTADELDRKLLQIRTNIDDAENKVGHYIL